MVYVGSYCGSRRGAWRMAGVDGSDSDACRSSNANEFSINEMHIDDWS